MAMAKTWFQRNSASVFGRLENNTGGLCLKPIVAKRLLKKIFVVNSYLKTDREVSCNETQMV